MRQPAKLSNILGKTKNILFNILGKTQNEKESFNGTIWECIPKNTFVALPNLEFGVYDGAAHCNIGIKASVWET